MTESSNKFGKSPPGMFHVVFTTVFDSLKKLLVDSLHQFLVGAWYVEMRVNLSQYAYSASKRVKNMLKISGSKNCSEIYLDYS